MFDVFYTGTKPNRFAHERPADSLEHAGELSRTRLYWYIYSDCDYANFDFSYVPPPWEQEHVHVWPTQWNQHGGAYLANKFTVNNHQWQFYKQVVPAVPTTELWQTHYAVDFDYSWQPHPHDPPYIYVFGNQWHGAERMLTVEYHVPGATERKYVYEPQARLLPTVKNWQVLADVDVDFDYSWCPDPHDPPYIYVFGNQHWTGERSGTVEYHVPGAVERKFVDDVKAFLGVLDIFFVDKSNNQSQARWEAIKHKYPTAQSIRYANSMIRTIERCATRARSPRFWVVSSENIYDDFDFDWHAEPWQQHMTHVFGSQWNKWSDTYLINTAEFNRHKSWAQGIEQFPNLNFVDNQQVYVPDDLHDIYYVDHNNSNDRDARERLLERYPRTKITRFVDNYLDTFKRIMTTATTEYVWICNSVCDYSKFDFTWQPEPWQNRMIHVFPSGYSIEGPQKRGDTFYIHVESFREQMYDLELLDWFNVINYCKDQMVPRLPMPIVYYDADTLVDPVKNYQFDFPHAMFTTEPELRQSHIVGLPCLWSAKDRQVEAFTQSGDTAIVPREIKSYLKTQIYDYPYIAKRSHLGELRCDVIFISNGESMAEEHWRHLLTICSDAKRSDGVTGRERAYKAAAEMSDTPWFFAVFAKTYVLPEFKFSFRPDYFQEPKHYIFHSRNPLNGLEYGAMNINLYNRQLVLDTDPGLDFTLSKAHDVIPVCASISKFNTDPWVTWRSAFRETMKLQLEVDQGAGIEIQYRLKTWLTVAEGENAEYCLQGARDGVEYYQSVNGDYQALELSFDWAWCQEYYYNKYQRKIWLEVI
jgi:hypothetical protein